MTPLRIGAVGYLNARPLVHGLDSHPDIALRFDVPARCAELLAAQQVDIGLIPVAEYRQDEYVAVAGICIGSTGPVASVALFSAKPVGAIRSVVLDASSRTSAALVRLLCRERWGIAPALTAGPPDLPGMLRVADAALLIGDPALEAESDRLGVLKIDLGAEWTALTGLPFVWALWAGRVGAVTPQACLALAAARDAGRLATETIAEQYAGGDPVRRQRAAEYLRTNIEFDLDAVHLAGLERFLTSASALGLASSAGRPRFVGAAEVARA